MNFPVWCACGKPVTFSNETRCEDCWAADQAKFHVGNQKIPERRYNRGRPER